jgi:uncharacterized protein with von Willebrand factor type A (vWA) domain
MNSTAPPGHLLRNIVLFGRLLRSLSLDVTPPQMIDFIAGLDLIDINRRDDVRDTGRTVLVNRPEHLALFDRAFDLFWQAREEQLVPMLGFGPQASESHPSDENHVVLKDGAHSNLLDDQDAAAAGSVDARVYSAQEVLRHKDFSQLEPDELVEIKRLMQAMEWQLEKRRTRRQAKARRGHRLDMRHTLRRNLGTGGEPLRLSWRQPKHKRRPLVVICDVSGSMEHYTRLLLQFVYVISNCLDRVETFVFSTRLTRITRQLACGDVDLALDQATESIRDWGGGTRIGQALRTFNYDWGQRVLGRGAAVLLVSDGLDRGDVDLLAREMARLQRSCQRLIWLNPLLGSRDYQPLARGMRTALPYVDDFLPVHNLASLEQLAQLLERLGEHRPQYRRIPTNPPAR